jgi:hypothetical protein
MGQNEEELEGDLFRPLPWLGTDCGCGVRYFGWPWLSQTARKKPLPCLSPFSGDREANTKPIGLGPLPTAPLYKRGSPPGDLSQSIYRVSLIPLSADQWGCWKVRKHEFLPQGITSVDQKATATEETALHFPDRRHRLHRLYTDLDRRDGYLHCRY